MKHILFIFLMAFIVSACQSTPESKENTTTPSSVSEVPTHNPPHGQPYHDCSIAVGAPLVNKQPAPTKENTRNPEHGKPGHRCDIPVGAPLT